MTQEEYAVSEAKDSLRASFDVDGDNAITSEVKIIRGSLTTIRYGPR